MSYLYSVQISISTCNHNTILYIIQSTGYQKHRGALQCDLQVDECYGLLQCSAALGLTVSIYSAPRAAYPLKPPLEYKQTFFKIEDAPGSRIITCPLSVPITRQDIAVGSSRLFFNTVMQVITVYSKVNKTSPHLCAVDAYLPVVLEGCFCKYLHNLQFDVRLL